MLERSDTSLDRCLSGPAVIYVSCNLRSNLVGLFNDGPGFFKRKGWKCCEHIRIGRGPPRVVNIDLDEIGAFGELLPNRLSHAIHAIGDLRASRYFDIGRIA